MHEDPFGVNERLLSTGVINLNIINTNDAPIISFYTPVDISIELYDLSSVDIVYTEVRHVYIV